MNALQRAFQILLYTGIAVMAGLVCPIHAQDAAGDSENLAELWRIQVAEFNTDAGNERCSDAQLDIVEYLRDHGIQRSSILAAAYTQLGRLTAAEGRYRDAQWAFDAALVVDPGYSEAANAAVFNGFHLSLGRGFSSVMRRIGILGNQLTLPRSGVLLLGNVAVTLHAAIVFTALVIIVIIMVRQFPLLVYEIQSLIHFKLNVQLTGLIAAVLLLMLWFTPVKIMGTLLIWLILALFFSDKPHRIMLWTTWILLFFVFPLNLIEAFSLKTAENRNLRIQEFVTDGGYSEPAIQELQSLLAAAGSAEERGKLQFMLGLLYKRGGFYSDAKSHYQEYIDQNPRDSRGYINLGNIAFIEDRVKSATEYYRKAETLDPRNPVIYYNLSRAYMSQFRFDDARDMQRRATQLDRERVQLFSENQSSKPVRMMVDETVPSSWFNDAYSDALQQSVREFREYWHPRFLRLSFTETLVLYSVLTLVLIGIRWLADRLKLSRYCLKCGHAMKPDPRTGGTDFVCVDCHMVYFKKGTASAQRDQKNRVIRETRDWNLWIHRLLSCLVPGGGRIYSGKMVTGLLQVFPWSILVAFLVLKNHYVPLSYHVPADRAPLDLWIVAIFLVVNYAISIIWGFREEEV